MQPDFVARPAGQLVGAQPDAAADGNNLLLGGAPVGSLLALWREVCERSSAMVVRADRRGNVEAVVTRTGKYLVIHEDDLVQLGGHIEGLTVVGSVRSRSSWPLGDLNEAGRLLPHGTPLLARKP